MIRIGIQIELAGQFERPDLQPADGERDAERDPEQDAPGSDQITSRTRAITASAQPL